MQIQNKDTTGEWEGEKEEAAKRIEVSFIFEKKKKSRILFCSRLQSTENCLFASCTSFTSLFDSIFRENSWQSLLFLFLSMFGIFSVVLYLFRCFVSFSINGKCNHLLEALMANSYCRALMICHRNGKIVEQSFLKRIFSSNR